MSHYHLCWSQGFCFDLGHSSSTFGFATRFSRVPMWLSLQLLRCNTTKLHSDEEPDFKRISKKHAITGPFYSESQGMSYCYFNTFIFQNMNFVGTSDSFIVWLWITSLTLMSHCFRPFVCCRKSSHIEYIFNVELGINMSL